MMSLAKRQKLDRETTVVTSYVHSTRLVNGVAALFDVNNVNNKFADVEVKVGDRTFYCHKLVLQLNSKYFDNLSLQSATMTIKNIKPDQFFDLLQFMYQGDILVSTDNIESLLAVAETLSIDDLKEVCLKHLADSLNIDYVLLCWRLANTYKQSGFAEGCQTQVIREFKKLNTVSSLLNVSRGIESDLK